MFEFGYIRGYSGINIAGDLPLGASYQVSLSVTDLIPGLGEIREIRFGRKVAIENRRSVKHGYDTIKRRCGLGIYVYTYVCKCHATLAPPSAALHRKCQVVDDDSSPASVRLGSIVLV